LNEEIALQVGQNRQQVGSLAATLA
jgi:hypothetical protein